MGLAAGRQTHLTAHENRNEIEILCEYRTCLIADVVNGELDMNRMMLPEENKVASDIDMADVEDNVPDGNEEIEE